MSHQRDPAAVAAVDRVIRERRSIRAFDPDSVSKELVREVLDVARWSPSGGNLQPWKTIVVTGEERDAVSQLALDVLAANPGGESEEEPIYPKPLGEPYRTRRYQLGEEMYALLAIPRSDKAARLRRFAENYRFFGASVGIFFVIERTMGRGQWAHLGMFMQTLALAASARGLASCFQESWAMVRKSLHAHFELSPDELVYCGMALGWPDREAAVNRLRSSRVEVDEFATFRGF